MDPQVEAAFDAWLASIGMNRNSLLPAGQEAYLSAQWESFLLNWGRTQGRTVVAAPGVYQGPPGGSFQVPVVQGGGFTGGMFGQPGGQPGGQPVQGPIRVAPPVGGGGQSPNQGGRYPVAPRYTPPPQR